MSGHQYGEHCGRIGDYLSRANPAAISSALSCAHVLVAVVVGVGGGGRGGVGRLSWQACLKQGLPAALHFLLDWTRLFVWGKGGYVNEDDSFVLAAASEAFDEAAYSVWWSLLHTWAHAMLSVPPS